MNYDAQILIVDDSPAFQKQFSDILEGKGYNTVCVTSGEEAIQLLLARHFDLVITDVIMPGMSGLNLLKVVKETNPETEVIIVTGNSSSFTVIKALRLGAYDFIVKPIDDDTILNNVVERTLEKRTLTLENRRLIQDLSEMNRALKDNMEMLKVVNSACAMIASTLDTGEILRKLVESAVDQLKAQKGYLLLLDRAGGDFSMKVCIGIDHHLAKGFKMPHDQGISGLVAAKNRPLRIGTNIPALLTPKILEEDRSGDLFSTPGILSAPLSIKNKVVGVVNISGRTNGAPFTEAETEFLTTLAGHAAIALNNAGSFYKLKKNGG